MDVVWVTTETVIEVDPWPGIVVVAIAVPSDPDPAEGLSVEPNADGELPGGALENVGVVIGEDVGTGVAPGVDDKLVVAVAVADSDPEAVFMIVNSGLALPESPNRTTM